MKRLTLSILAIVALCIGFVQLGHAGPIYTVQTGATVIVTVGEKDTFLGAAPKAGNPTAEEAFIEALAGGLDYVRKDETNVTAYKTIEDAAVLAVDITPGTDFYVLKNAGYMAAFENLDRISWAVFDTAMEITIDETVKVHGQEVEVSTTQSFSDFFNLGPQVAVSHITLFDDGNGGNGGGETNTNPTPGPLALMGLGLAGLGFTRLRKS